MAHSFTAVVSADGDSWIGWVVEVPGVIGQEPTRDELMKSLNEALGELLEATRNKTRQSLNGFDVVALV